MLRAKFEEWPYDNYDGLPLTDANRIAVGDIAPVYQLGARTRRTAYERLLRSRGRVISGHLATIPRGRALEDIDLNRPALRASLHGLFDLLLNTKFIKLVPFYLDNFRMT